MNALCIITIILPALFGSLLVLSSFHDHRKITLETGGRENVPEEGNVKGIHVYTMLILVISMIGVLYMAWTGERSIVLLPFLENLPIYLHIDDLGRFFVTLATIIWLLIGIFSMTYMEHEGEQKRFFGFFMIVYTVLVFLFFAGNLVTMYLFYEMMTLTTVPLVMHNGKKEAVMAGLKYLFYSMCGAYMGLFGIFFLNRYTDLTFVTGGTLSSTGMHRGMLLLVVFVMILGFGAKAGMFPLHAWLPTAHPVAPSPASAMLSAIVVKGGAFATIRVIYYIVGADLIRGSWVQYLWMALSLLTVIMGSLMAYLEPVLKKRLAYSTVSQVSYILFGLSLLTETGFMGALLHVACHAVIKSGLFLCAGAFVYCGHITKVDELRGIGKKMPVVLWCWTFFSLALVGIPPFCGFISKWYLALGALETKVGIFSYLGPIALLISALLTAGYLLPVTMQGFFPGEKEESKPLLKASTGYLIVPLVILAAISLMLGILPNPILGFLQNMANGLL